MQNNWQAGDLALCVKGDEWRYGSGPRTGSINVVRAVGFDRENSIGLWFEGWPGDRSRDGFRAYAFRKIHPHTPDEQDAETITLLKRQPVGEPA